MKEILGYKWLARLPDGRLVSPVYYGFREMAHDQDCYPPADKMEWTNGELEAHEIPKAYNNEADIYAYKSIADSIEQYFNILFNSRIGPTLLPINCKPVLVEVILSGIVIEGETGYRAQYAVINRIIEEKKEKWDEYRKDYKNT